MQGPAPGAPRPSVECPRSARRGAGARRPQARALAREVLGGAVSQRALLALEGAITSGQLDRARAAAVRFRRALRVEELIRVVIFALMVLPL